MSLETLREKNPAYDIMSVFDPSFAEFGCVHEGVSVPKMEAFVRATPMPEDEFYIPCADELMNMGDETGYIVDTLYGQAPAQIGYYNGHAHKLNAVEWHKCSEILVLFEDVVLILGKLTDIVDDRFDTAKARYFFVPAGTCVELYATTLHWSPCQAGPDGVRQLVIQAMGTNTPLERPVKREEGMNRQLLERNKWVLIHEEAPSSMAPEAFVGIVGEYPEIAY